MKRLHITTLLFATSMLATSAAHATGFKNGNDLRDFYIGMPVSEISQAGYEDLVCAGDRSRHLSQWSEFAHCPRDAHGFHAVTFHYDEAANPLAHVSEKGQGTKVAGQPIVPTLLIDDNHRLAGLSIVSDPDAKLFERRRAYLFGLQVKAKFGEDGWACHEAEPSANEQPIGPSFIKEHCEKITPDRKFVLDRQLFRDPTRSLRDFVSETRLVILEPGTK